MGLILELKEVGVKLSGKSLLDQISFCILDKQNWAIVGPSGSGKTCLAKAIAGKMFHQGTITRYFSGAIGFVPQQHRFTNKAHVNNFYYQQRFQSQDADDAETVRETLITEATENTLDCDSLLEQFHLKHLLDKPLLHLSNGENKRLQITKALLKKPEVLLLDHPFIGLDKTGRTELHDVFKKLMLNGLHLIIITSPSEIPEGITHVLQLDEGKIAFAGIKQAWLSLPQKKDERYQLDSTLLDQICQPHTEQVSSVLDMKNISIKYGETTILREINWTVETGSHWCVSGSNGAGKSTLLSLISADNPQAYANEIYLFGKKKGSGESIWQIKQKMGYVSPELHLYFPQSCSCFDVIASGLFDTIGLFKKLTEDQFEKVSQWVKVFKLEDIAFNGLHQVSLSQQRMALLARALVKNPLLLVLDEPCQGLDDEQTRFINEIVDRLCQQAGTSLIYVSHYQNQLPQCVDQFLHIENGQGKITRRSSIH